MVVTMPSGSEIELLSFTSKGEPHIHLEDEVAQCLSGSGVIVVGGRKYNMMVGSTIRIPKNVEHYMVPDETPFEFLVSYEPVDTVTQKEKESEMSKCKDKCLCGKKNELDPNVVAVMEKHKSRAEVGMTKYGVDTTRTDTDLLGWLNHLQEELMDANVYIERTMHELKVREEDCARREELLCKGIIPE